MRGFGWTHMDETAKTGKKLQGKLPGPKGP